MTASHDRWSGIVAPRASGKNIANGINPDCAARCLGLGYKKVAALTIKLGQGQTAYAAFLRGTDFG